MHYIYIDHVHHTHIHKSTCILHRWGPPRLSWCMLFEMKNGHMKRACRRSNFFNPGASIVSFYIDQADYFWQQTQGFWQETRDRRPDGMTGDALGITLCSLVAQGSFAYFTDVDEASVLQATLILADEDRLRFYQAVSIRGIIFELEKYVLIGPATDCILGKTRSIMETGGGIYIWVAVVPDVLLVDRYGNLSADFTDVDFTLHYELVSIANAGQITALWDYPDYQDSQVRRFIVRW